MSSFDDLGFPGGGGGGDNRHPRYNASDGRYYTVTFPNDFVGVKKTNTDAFRGYRKTGADV